MANAQLTAYWLLAPRTKRLNVNDLYGSEAEAWREALEALRYEGYEAGASDPPRPTVEQAQAAGWRVVPVRIEEAA